MKRYRKSIEKNWLTKKGEQIDGGNFEFYFDKNIFNLLYYLKHYAFFPSLPIFPEAKLVYNHPLSVTNTVTKRLDGLSWNFQIIFL